MGSSLNASAMSARTVSDSSTAFSTASGRACRAAETELKSMSERVASKRQ